MHFKARSVKKSLYNEWQLQCKNGNYNDFFVLLVNNSPW